MKSLCKRLTSWLDYIIFGNKSQCAMINGCKSESVTVASGIPYGSVLGPRLFVIYINGLPDSVELNVYLFAEVLKYIKVLTH